MLRVGSAQLCIYFQSVCLSIPSSHGSHYAKKQEPLPTLKAAIRLLTHIFSVVTDIPEFQRQIASPNVPKFSLQLIIIAEGHSSRELKVGHYGFHPISGSQHLQLLAIDALYVLVPLYPTLHKALHGRLSALCLRQLSCSAGQPTDGSLSQAISRLYSVLAVTGGKVGAAGLWRKSVDEILSIGWASLGSLRTTFPNDGLIRYLAFELCTKTKFSEYGSSHTVPAIHGRCNGVHPVKS